MVRLKLICGSLLLGACGVVAAVFPAPRAVAGDEIQLDYIAYFPDDHATMDNDGKKVLNSAGFDDTRRHYTIHLDKNPLHDLVFVANRLKWNGTWSLQFSIGKPLRERAPGEKPDFDPLNQIPDKEKLVLDCIDRFVTDVPDARVTLVEIDPRLHGALWAGFHDRMAALLKKKRANVSIDELHAAADDYFTKSAVGKEFAATIGKKLNAKVTDVDFDCEVFIFDQQGNWSELLKSPYLGFNLDYQAFGISLKPNPPAQK
ncbi:MAG TPA: hypothetical protein VG733_14175 [Chthoniobacteraceae bacterium]|nr:hypothetical protein [Chthoniobacteraceae bacterium]